MQKVFWIIIISILIFFAYYFSRFHPLTNPQTNKYTGPIEKIRIGNIGEHSIFNLIAKEKGFFTDNGLDAEIIEYSSGPPAIEALLNKEVDFAVAAEFVGVNFISANKDLRILSQQSQHDIFRVIARIDRGISQPTDLKNKKVGVTLASAGEFFLGEFLNFHQLSFKDIRVIGLTPANIISQLEAGSLDAAVTFEPHSYNLQQKLPKQFTVWSAQGTQKISALLFSINTYIQAHTNVVERYLQSLLQAEEFLKTNEPEAKQILINSMKYSPDYVDHIWPKFTFRISLDQALLISMEDEALFRIQNQLTSDKVIPNYINYIYFDALQALKPESISIIR